LKNKFPIRCAFFQLNRVTSVPLRALCATLAFWCFQFQAAAENDQDHMVSAILAPLVPEPGRATRQNSDLPSKRYGLIPDITAFTVGLSRFERSYVVPFERNQIGVHRHVGVTSRSHGHAFQNSDGSEVVFVAITSPGALSMRVHFDGFDIPDGDEVYVYGNTGDSSAAGPYELKGLWNDGDFWSATIEGDTAIIEYYRKGRSGEFSIPEVAHVYEELHAEGSPNAPDTLTCEVDASCFSDAEKNAVARIVFEDNGSYVCTGTALNDRAEDFAPYFLTANHCVDTQTVARTVQSYWFYQTTSCNSGTLKNWIRRSSGADLLVTDRSNDSTLLRLIDSVPAGAWFSGWDSSTIAAGTAVFGLHHPDGYSPPSVNSHLRRSSGSIATTSSSCSDSGLVSAFNVEWSSGTIEGGSSGSGLWTTNSQGAHLVGALSCGPDPDTCSSPYGIYAKFSNFYPQIRSIIYAARKADFNSDANSDIVWQNVSTGQRTIWLMNRTSYAGEAGLPGNLTAWVIGGTGDFDKDGNTDIVWYNKSTGQRTLWLMKGTSYDREVTLPSGPTSWDVGGVGDFDKDGNVDIVWYNKSTGQRTLWLMKGTSYDREASLPSGSTAWDIGGTGDFDKDGNLDIVWFNKSTGQRTIWLMKGASYDREGSLPTGSTAWAIGGTGDFDRDGNMDILWQDDSGQHTIWLMNGTSYWKETGLQATSSSWKIRNH
jgi:hypothetical protein